jgi:hypothetical protein
MPEVKWLGSNYLPLTAVGSNLARDVNVFDVRELSR